ncbi:methyl-accepting chemotaxis protein [Ekhidna sp.]|uniref:methyl-accepting chemotaxis protein n=1 Tax=Ekhidna sp. TaxID=2608089 RepID=UPI003B50F7BE
MIDRLKLFISRFNIAKKVALSSVVVITLATFSGVYSFITLRSSRAIDSELTENIYPLISHLKDYEDLVDKTNSLATNWMYLPNPEDKSALNEIETKEYPALRKLLISQLESVDDSLQNRLRGVVQRYDKIVPKIAQLKSSLNSNEAYEDDFLLFELIPLLDDEITIPLKELKVDINALTQDVRKLSITIIDSKFNSFDNVEAVIILMTLMAMIIGTITTILTTRSIIRPIYKMNSLINKMSKGELPEVNVNEKSDEIGDMISSMKVLREGLVKTAQFADEIKKGNLDIEHSLLGPNDVLGKALILMRDNLKNVIEETNSIVQLVSNEGQMDKRLELNDKSGAWSDLCQSINSLFESISMPMKEVQSIMAAMADGNLSVRYDESVAKGEVLRLANSLNYAMENLSKLLTEISGNASVIDQSSSEMVASGEEMSTSTGEIASAIAQMSHGAQSQVQKVDESSQLVENILTSSKDMASRSEAINAAAKKGVLDSEKGGQMVFNVTNSINEIMGVSSSTNESMQVLLQRSTEIERVLGVITDIASQTNLLALNAAIEAAQAGDAGRGFAVVAEEIRKLAEDSRNSAKEIEKLITAVSSDTEKAAKMMDAMRQSVSKGVNASQEASSVFEDMATSSSQTLDYSEDILRFSKEQSAKIKEVVNNTESIVVIAEQTSAGTEEIASSAEELSSGMTNYIKKSKSLNDISLKLKEGLTKFKLS